MCVIDCERPKQLLQSIIPQNGPYFYEIRLAMIISIESESNILLHQVAHRIQSIRTVSYNGFAQFFFPQHLNACS